MRLESLRGKWRIRRAAAFVLLVAAVALLANAQMDGPDFRAAWLALAAVPLGALYAPVLPLWQRVGDVAEDDQVESPSVNLVGRWRVWVWVDVGATVFVLGCLLLYVSGGIGTDDWAWVGVAMVMGVLFSPLLPIWERQPARVPRP